MTRPALYAALALTMAAASARAGEPCRNDAGLEIVCPDHVADLELKPLVDVAPSPAPAASPSPAPKDDDFRIEASAGAIASLSANASAAEPFAELLVGFDLYDTAKAPRLDLQARFGAAPGVSALDLENPESFRSLAIDAYVSVPLADKLKIRLAGLLGTEFRFDKGAEAEPLHRAARFGYLGFSKVGAHGFLFVGVGGDERLSRTTSDQPQYLPAGAATWRLRLRQLTGDLHAYLVGRVLLYLRLGYGALAAGSDVAQVGVTIGGGR